MLFDRFPNRGAAEAFAAAVQARFGRETAIYDTREASEAADPFLFWLDPPIVHVSRNEDLEGEEPIEAFVSRFGGTFAGT
jgi:hypothetical protein